jgi:hypothetical protein
LIATGEEMRKRILTNRAMSEALDIPISKIRRNTKEFLGDDPRAARRAGVMREFSLNDGFFVFLGGGLVTDFNLTFGNARRALDVIKPWLLKNYLVPEPTKESGPREGVDAGGPFVKKIIAGDDIYKRIESGEITLEPGEQGPSPYDEVTTEFYVTLYLSEGRISEICEVRVVAASDIFEGQEDDIDRKYHMRYTEEYYYFFRNNHGELEYFNPKTKIEKPGLTMRLTVENPEIRQIWKRSKSIGELQISTLLWDFQKCLSGVM